MAPPLELRLRLLVLDLLLRVSGSTGLGAGNFNVENHTNDEPSAARPTEYTTTPGRAATARPGRRKPTVPPVSPRTSHQRRRPRGRWGTPHRTGTGQCAPP